MLDRVPIRLRLVGAFAAAMIVLVVAGSVGIHRVVAGSLDRSIDQGLRARIDDLASAAATSDQIPSRTLVTEESSFAQVLAANGDVIASSERFAGEPVLTHAQIRDALRTPTKLSRADDGTPNAVRILATRATQNGAPVVVLVGVSLQLRNQTLHDLTQWLYIGGSIGILVATLLGYALSARALGAMDRVRRAASQIDHRSLGARLPEPPANDELRALTRTLNDLLARIDAAFERERRFIGDASHELRTPVALIKSELEVALLEPFDVENFNDARDYIAMMRRRVTSAEAEADSLTQLANSLLIIAQEDEHALAGTNGDRRAFASVDVYALLERVTARFLQRAHTAHRSIALAPSQHRETRTVFVDPLRLEQTVSNLIDNALKHGTGDITLEVDAFDPDWATIRVLDDGPGIPSELRATAFDRFARGDDARASGAGAGLGLAIVAMVTAAHGGITTIDGQGFVTLRLPTHES